jgi:MFS family permease
MTQTKPETLDVEQQNGDSGLQNIPYSIFSKTQKRWIVLCIAFAGMFSPLSSFIYYPAIHSPPTDLHTSVEAVNLSITVYMIVSGITPSILGDAADQIGRRPIYIFAFLVYFFANVGLALQQSYPALLVLRMVQSVGSSGAHIPIL